MPRHRHRRAGRDKEGDGREYPPQRGIRINLVSEEAATAGITGINFRPGERAARGRLTTEPSTHVKPPRIAESPVAFECQLYQIIDLPTERLLVLGKVVAAHIRDEAVLDPAKCYIDTPKLNLIGRMHGRGWYTRLTDWFQLPPADAGERRPGSKHG